MLVMVLVALLHVHVANNSGSVGDKIGTVISKVVREDAVVRCENTEIQDTTHHM